MFNLFQKIKKRLKTQYFYDKQNKEYKYNDYRSSNTNKYPLYTIRSFHKYH